MVVVGGEEMNHLPALYISNYLQIFTIAEVLDLNRKSVKKTLKKSQPAPRFPDS